VTCRPRVAVFTPLPPSQSGVADYAARLLPYLSAHAELHIFVDVDQPPQPLAPFLDFPIHQVAHIDWLRRFERFDAYMFFLGNSGYHVQSLAQLRHLGGLVVAHDVHLGGIYTLGGFSKEPLSETLRRLYGEELAREVRAAEQGSGRIPALISIRELLRRHNVYLTKELVSWADRVLVHSEHAARIVRAENPERPDRVGVLPFAFPAPSLQHNPGAETVVACFGIVAPEKHASLIAVATGLLADRSSPIEVRMVGPVDREYADHLTEIARLRSPKARLTFTGRVDSRTYAEQLSSATLAVQLRAVFNGEASAAVADCLSAGVPTIVPDTGWFAELPPDVVSHVPFDIGPDGLADAIEALATDPARRSALSDKATIYAASVTFEDVAGRLAEELERMIPARLSS
jgi:glycosyltransferase involved in cell wall biosynthesis